MAEVASAYVSLMFSAKGAQGQIAKEIGGSGKAAGASASKGFKSSFLPGLKGLAAPLAGVLGVSKAIDFFKDANAEAREAQKVGALTTSVIKATGGAAKVTAKQVGDLAGALSSKTGIDDEVIQSGQNMLLTFRNIRNETGKGNDIFNQASKSLIDMSSAMGTEPRQAAIQLGKALNDPVKGVTALGRAGVQFTDQQKAQIKTLVESGRTMDAQKIILKELNSEFGGAAAAQATAGDKAAVAMGNLKEQVGTALLPTIDRLATFFSGTLVPAVSGFITGMQEGTGAGGQFADVARQVGAAFMSAWSAIKPVGEFLMNNKAAVGAFAGVILTVVAALKIWTAVQTVLNVVMTANPIGLIVVAIAALVAGVVYAYQHFETFRAVLDAVFGFMKSAVVATIGFVKDHWRLIISILMGPLGIAIALVTKHWDTFKKGATVAFDAVKAAAKFLWNNVLQPVFKFIVKGIGGLMLMWGKMLQTLGKVPGFGWAKKAGDAMVSAGNKAIDMADKIKDIPDHKDVKITVDTPNLTAISKDIDWVARPREARITVTKAYAAAGRDTAGGLQARASGGPVTKGQTYLVGEEGPELWTAHASGTIIPHGDSMRALSGRGGPQRVILDFGGGRTLTGWIDERISGDRDFAGTTGRMRGATA